MPNYRTKSLTQEVNSPFTIDTYKVTLPDHFDFVNSYLTKKELVEIFSVSAAAFPGGGYTRS